MIAEFFAADLFLHLEQKLQSEFLSSLIPRFFDLLFLRCVFICPFAFRFFCAQSLVKHRLPTESSHACKKRFSRAKGSVDSGLSLSHGRCSRKKHRPKSPCHIFKNRSDQIGRRAIFIVRRLFACLLGIFQCPLCFSLRLSCRSANWRSRSVSRSVFVLRRRRSFPASCWSFNACCALVPTCVE